MAERQRTEAKHVCIAGASARAAAASAARAGFRVTAIDAYGDLDQHPGVCVVPLRPGDARFTAEGAAEASRAFACDAVAYLSPFENHPRAVARLADGRQLWGTSPRALARVRHPVHVSDALRRRGLPAPDTRATAPTSGRGARQWLLKPRASGGGHHVRPWNGQSLAPSWYLQEHLEGIPASVVFVAARGRIALLGLSRQLVGDAAFGVEGYRYCGSILPAASDPVWGRTSVLAARARQIAEAVADGFDVAGITGIDLVVCGDVPQPVEVNPRWCASVELVERASGVPVFGAHAEACASGALPEVDLWSGADVAVGKAVVFARHAATAEGTDLWCADRTVADVPRPGTRVERGQPVCTVFAEGPDIAACHAALAARAERVYAEMASWPR